MYDISGTLLGGEIHNKVYTGGWGTNRAVFRAGNLGAGTNRKKWFGVRPIHRACRMDTSEANWETFVYVLFRSPS